jgi:hypothetical protein
MTHEIEYSGSEKTNLELQEATALAQGFLACLADGRTEFSLTYEKNDSGTTLVIKTLPAVAPKKPVQRRTAVVEPTPPQEPKEAQ